MIAAILLLAALGAGPAKTFPRLELGPVGLGYLSVLHPRASGADLHLAAGLELDEHWVIRERLNVALALDYNSGYADLGVAALVLYRWKPTTSVAPFLGGGIGFRDLGGSNDWLGLHHTCPADWIDDCSDFFQLTGSQHLQPELTVGLDWAVSEHVRLEGSLDLDLQAVSGKFVLVGRARTGIAWSLPTR